MQMIVKRLSPIILLCVLGAAMVLVVGAAPASRSLDLTRFECDKGMIAAAKDGVLELTIQGVPYSNLELAERCDYHETDTVTLDIASIKNGELTLQAVSYDDAPDGKPRYVDLLENQNTAGRFEVPLRIYRTPLAGTKKIGFKIWLGGKNPSATIASVQYGADVGWASPTSTAAASTEEVGSAHPTGAYNLPAHPPYLIAHYMQWYSTPWSTIEGNMVDRTAKDWSHWQWKGGKADHHPDNKLADGHRDIASVLYPLIGPYDSGSRAVIRYHLATMKAAGISAVTAIWYGPGSNTDKRFPLLLDEAEKLGMRAMICYEEKSNFPGYRHPKTREEFLKNATADFTYIIKSYGDHPGYLKRNGLPVIQQFNATGASEIGPHKFTPDEFREIFEKLPTKVAYIRQNLAEMYHPPVPGAYVWWDQSDWPARFATRAAELRDARRLEFFMTMVCPGFNDTGVWGWGPGPRVSKGYGIDVLKWTENQALEHDPELVQCVTWNDFNEATCFEPTAQHGFDFVDELERWWGEKTGRAVDLDDNRAAFEQYKRECSAAERAEIPTP